MISGVDYIEELRVVLNKKTDNSHQSALMSDASYHALSVAFTDAFDLTEERDASFPILESIFINNIISSLGYSNILVIPQGTGDFTDIVDNHISKGDLSAQSFSVINKYFDCQPNVYIAYPEVTEGSTQRLIREFNVNTIVSNKPYVIGDETYTVTKPDGVSFDAVILAGININEGETFNASDLKNDFAQYCTTDFDLIDMFADDDNNKAKIYAGEEPLARDDRITGVEKNIDEIINTINTTTIKFSSQNDTIANVMSRFSSLVKRFVKVY